MGGAGATSRTVPIDGGQQDVALTVIGPNSYPAAPTSTECNTGHGVEDFLCVLLYTFGEGVTEIG
jgi:hypothetical protein